MKEVERWLATVGVKCVISMCFQEKTELETTIFSIISAGPSFRGSGAHDSPHFITKQPIFLGIKYNLQISI
jgi:hypothetical protein